MLEDTLFMGYRTLECSECGVINKLKSRYRREQAKFWTAYHRQRVVESLPRQLGQLHHNRLNLGAMRLRQQTRNASKRLSIKHTNNVLTPHKAKFFR